ncbi:hypothetical protein RRG08_036562 [Elysia crispata]|uniref:Homeobox domain-containing protein n=1 Tax=Elysia crispata TaxID=231223 RepID=A0AAE0XXJ6_9GAST|nr:hypothetical protein RRG08_036562 [Elysia crispata]
MGLRIRKYINRTEYSTKSEELAIQVPNNAKTVSYTLNYRIPIEMAALFLLLINLVQIISDINASSPLHANTSGSKSLPIHCVVEQSPPTCASQQQERAHGVAAPSCSAPIVVLDSYAILPGATPFCDVVSASLSKLGFSSIEAREATGGIQLKNWKTLPLEAVTDRREATIEEMLGELTSVATLRVHLTRSNPGSEEVKEKLMQLLLTQSKDLLLQAGCPIDKSQLDSLSTGEVTQNLSDTVCSAFHHWYARQMESLARGEDKTDGIPHSKKQNAKANESSCHASSLLITPSPTLLSSLKREPLSRAKEDNFSSTPEPRANNQDQNGNVSSPASSYGKHALTVNNLPMPAECEEKMPDKGLGKEGIVHSKTRQDNHPNSSHGKIPSSLRDAVSGHSLQSTLHYHSHALIPQVTASSVNGSGSIPGHIPSINSSGGGGGGGGGGGNGTPYLGLMPGKTRIRTSFDPEHEIPRLHKWFSHNQHPTREQMLRYMHELNGLESRRGRRPLDLTNIIYWFKNARAAQRRACKALDDSLDDPGGAGEDGRSVEDSNGHPQHRESMADNGDPNEDSGGGGGGSLDCNGSSAIADANLPPYLPNKNAVYMIPFHPYLQASPSGHARMPTPLPGLGADASGEDQPYDLSLTKRRSSRELSPLPHKRQAREPLPGQEDAEGTPMEHSQDLTNGKNKVHFLSKSPNISDSEVECHTKRRSDSSHSNTPFFLPSSTSPICPPRFPALLDAASKMRQEIPAQSEEEHSTTTLTFPGSQRRLPDKNQDPTEGSLGYPSNGIPAYNGSGSTSPMCGERGKTVVDKSHHGHMEKGEYKDRAAANSVTSPRLNSLPNGTLPSHIFGVSIKEEDEKDELSAKHQKPGSSPRSRQSSNGAQSATSHSPDSGLELGQIHKESNRSGTHVKHSFSDEDDVENDDNVYRRERKNSYAGGRDRGAARSHGDNDSGEELEYHNHRGSSYHNHQQHPMDSMDLDSEAELLKLRLKQSKDYADYASAAAMHSNVSRLTAANMAALSLAQMGGLHLPQLPPSLAMAYYPMDPRFYPAVGPPPHSSSSPTPLTRSSVVTPSSSPSTISPHLHTHLHSHRADSRSPLPSPSAVSVAQGIPQLNHLQPHPHQHQSLSPSGQHSRGQMNSSEPRKRRTRVFIDPLTEIPKLEKWFLEDTHPSAFMIDKFCEELNTCEYRHKFPKLEPKNVQLWFKNHRAKVKRMKTVSTSDGSGGGDIGRDDLDDDMDDKVSVLNCLSTSDAGRGGGDQGRDHMEEEDVDDEMKYIFQN